MSSLNKVQVIGRVGKDPKIQDVNGTTKADFSIAASEKYKNKSGELVEHTEWINVVFWGNVAGVVERFVKKGDLLYVEGKLKTTMHETGGEKKYYTFVNGFSLQMLGSKQESTTQESTTQSPPIGDEDDLPF